jgi:hypothetical protein
MIVMLPSRALRSPLPSACRDDYKICFEPERREISHECASSIGVAPLTIGGAMSEPSAIGASKPMLRFAMSDDGVSSPARRVREAPQ